MSLDRNNNINKIPQQSTNEENKPANKEELNIPDFSIGMEYEDLTPELKEKKILERQKNWVFDHLVETKLYDSLINSLKKYGFTEEEITEFDRIVKNLSINEYNALVSFPYELKERRFPYAINQIRNNEITIEQLINQIVKMNLEKGRTVAYHTSDKEVLPIRKNNKETGEWVVYGTEKDHRDNDNYMAYYSFDYADLYRKKNPNHLYAVSIQTKGKSGDKKDNTGVWGRAPSLTVIEHLDVKELDKRVEEEMERIRKAKNKK